MAALEQLALVWCGVILAVYLAKRTRMTPVLYYLAVGAIFVNFHLLPETPHEFIRGFAEIGIILIMFALGFEEKVSDFLDSIKRSWGIALFGAIAPFLTAYFIADFFWHDPDIALMCGLAMTATAVSLTMVTLRSEGLRGSLVATRIMTSAILDDIASLALLAILIPVATGDASPDIGSMVVILAKVVLFFLVVSILGMWIFPYPVKGPLSRWPIIRHFGFFHLLRINDGENTTLIVLLLALSVGLLAHAFGFHPAVGAYMAGLILREEYFGTGSRLGYQATKSIVDNVAFSWIGPVFFVVLGTNLVIDWPLFVAVFHQAVILTVALFVTQILSAAVAARYTSGLGFAGSVMVGLGMLGRAELAFVVMDIAYVQHQILSREAFYTLMFTAFWLNVAVPVTIRLWKPFYSAELLREAGNEQKSSI
jgi:Kef-type K+ transport system membrane component KefB